MLPNRALAFLFLASISIFCGCNASNRNSPGLETETSAAQLALPPARSIALADLEQEIRQSPPPPGVETEVYELMKDQLIKVIQEREISKVVAAPPSGEINKIKDLRLYGSETSEFRLEWTYVNVGDLNLDGLVSINDLTPIGLHFDECVDGENWIAACRADGNCDGLVNISDITPIGQHYQAYCTGYNIYGADSSGGPWTMLGELALPKAPSTELFKLSYIVPGGDYWYYQVRPHDSEGAEGIASEVSRPMLQPADVELGLDSYLVEQEITPAGGSLETDLGVPEQHIKVTFPEGAVEDAFTLRIGMNDGSYTPYMGDLKSPIVAFDFGGDLSLLKPVTMEVKFDRNDILKSVVPFIVDNEGRLHLVDVIAMKSPEFVAEFQTNALLEHMLWLVQQPELGTFDGKIRSTEFQPVYDGFQIEDDGSYWHEYGESFGMAAFAGWYFSAGFTWWQGELYPRFMYYVKPAYPGFHPRGQNVIACRAHASICKERQYYWANFIQPQTELNDAQRFAAVVNGIANAGHPVLVNLRGSDTSYTFGHTVLAYAYDAEGLYIYDTDYPGEEKYIHMNFGTGHFDPYRQCESIRYSGPGALWVDEPFGNILLDAIAGFEEVGETKIYITSHSQDEQVPVGNVTVEGYIEYTDLAPDLIIAVVDSVPYAANVSPTGEYSITVPVTVGEEKIWLIAYGYPAFQSKAQLTDPGYLRLIGVEGS